MNYDDLRPTRRGQTKERVFQFLRIRVVNEVSFVSAPGPMGPQSRAPWWKHGVGLTVGQFKISRAPGLGGEWINRNL